MNAIALSSKDDIARQISKLSGQEVWELFAGLTQALGNRARAAESAEAMRGFLDLEHDLYQHVCNKQQLIVNSK